MMLSLAVQIGLALPMAEYFHRISFTGIFANILIVPLMNLVIPFGFAALFTGWHWLASIVSLLLRASASIARYAASSRARAPRTRPSGMARHRLRADDPTRCGSHSTKQTALAGHWRHRRITRASHREPLEARDSTRRDGAYRY